jgi:hypothetical protein
MMCSSATALHALNKARFKAGESIAIFGFRRTRIFGIAIGTRFRLRKMSTWLKSILRSSRQLPACELWRSTPGPQIRSIKSKGNRCKRSRRRTRIDWVCKNMRQAVLCLGPLGRAALVGLTAESMSIHPYTELSTKKRRSSASPIISRLNFQHSSNSRAAGNFDFRQRHCALLTSTQVRSMPCSIHLRLPPTASGR